MKTYTEKRFFKWVEDEVSVSLRASSASYGGGSEVLVDEPIVYLDDITIKVDGGSVRSPLVQETSKECNA